ncbi:MAG: mutS 5 [Mucilaginibacter sp.]|nr:mutS 5 [Mucilaginibacter sp.]
MEQNIIDNYQQRIAFATEKADKYKRLANTYSLLRLGIFALIILATSFAILRNDFTILAVAFIVLMFGFMWLVSRQSFFEKQKQYYLDLKKINENEAGSIFNYTNIYNNGSRFASDGHYYSADLDIYGNASLFQLINRAATHGGNNKLANWLSAPAKKETIQLRQEAVKDLSSKTDWKLDLQARLLFAKNEEENQLQMLFKYLQIPLNLSGEKWLKIYSKLTPYLLLAVFAGGYFYHNLITIGILIGLGNLAIVSLKAEYIKKADMIAGKIGQTLGNYAVVFEKAEQEQWQSPYCVGLIQKLKEGQTSAQIKQLAELINKLNYHLNLIVGAIINFIFLWDIRQIIAIENWKRDNHENMEAAFDVLAEFEALISIASLASNYPDWCFPVIFNNDNYTLTAKNLAHPLISINKRIENDYELNDTFKIDIITGSNMAGKSTFLRTIGINTVLALCGAPVCASEMTVSVIQVLTYMRIKDSLNESTSTFKAELDRLQMLLKAVQDEKVFFLIDEMLRGTNSVDKYLGSKAVIEQLIRKKAVGMVATHDLQIAELEKTHPDYIRNFYFDIQVKDGEMLFDYKIKHGECKTFNASLLLKQIGIDVDA